MLSVGRWLLVRARGLLGGAAAARQSLVALAFNSTTSFVAGVVLGSITGVFERLPGLLIMVPAAIGLRGNISTAFGNRLATAIHRGEFRLSWRRQSLLVQNLEASFILNAALSVALAVVAKIGAIALGIDGVSVLTLALVSITAGLLSSLVVHAVTVALAGASVRYDWDLDNVVAPVDSTFGDVLTLPALWLTSHLAGIPGEAVWSWALIILSLVVFARGLARTAGRIVRDVTRQAWPILLAAAGVQIMAGLVLERRLESLAVVPALLVLQPAFVSSAGALGGIFSSRLASNLHLGTVQPTATPGRRARQDAALLVTLALAVYLFDGIGAHIAARLTGLHSPGMASMATLSLTAGIPAVAFVMVVAYYSAVSAYRLRADPDIYGVPAVTSSVDLFGSVILIALATILVLS